MPFKLLIFAFLLVAAFIFSPVRAWAATPIIVVNSITELVSMNGSKNPVVELLSYHPRLGKGGGLFVWNATAKSAADNCITFARFASRRELTQSA